MPYMRGESKKKMNFFRGLMFATLLSIPLWTISIIAVIGWAKILKGWIL